MEMHDILPNDLMEDIVLRLPVRHLLRLRCVNKSICALIDSARFIEKHYQIQSAISNEEGDAPLFLTYQASDYNDKDLAEFYLLSKKLGDEILCLTPDLDRDRGWPIDFLTSHHCCMGFVNGVVGLCWGEESLGLWNPATREFKVVPPSRHRGMDNFMELCIDILGFGFDPKSNDFKIVRSMCCADDGYLCEMYSLSTDSWQRLELPSSPHPQRWVNFSSTDVYYNGAYYWTAIELDWNDCLQRYVILSFDFSREAFECLDAPDVVVMAAEDGVNAFDWMVGLYMERLALILYCRKLGAEYSFEIWVATESYVGDGSKISLSWQHLFNIKTPDMVHHASFVAFRMDGDVLLNIHHDSVVKECNIYNPSRTLKHLNGLLFHSGFKYVESLFSLSKRRIPKFPRA